MSDPVTTTRELWLVAYSKNGEWVEASDHHSLDRAMFDFRWHRALGQIARIRHIQVTSIETLVIQEGER